MCVESESCAVLFEIVRLTEISCVSGFHGWVSPFSSVTGDWPRRNEGFRTAIHACAKQVKYFPCAGGHRCPPHARFSHARRRADTAGQSEPDDGAQTRRWQPRSPSSMDANHARRCRVRGQVTVQGAARQLIWRSSRFCSRAAGGSRVAQHGCSPTPRAGPEREVRQGGGRHKSAPLRARPATRHGPAGDSAG